MSRSAFHGRARGGGRALASMLLAIGGLASCGPGQQDAADAASAVVAQAIPPDKAECRRWTTCVPENPCHTGWVTGCRKNEPICTDIGGWLSNGTTCGTDAVCYMGECEACAAGQSCPINGMYGTPDPCKAGQIFCDTGQPVCKEVGPAPDGTYCGYEGGGSPYFCKGGQCTWCQEGATSCQLPEDPCQRAVLTQCATTGGTCTGTGEHWSPGFACGDNRVCTSGGDCVACTWYATCTPPPQPPSSCIEQSAEGYTTCSDGPQCFPYSTWWKPDGTQCDGGVCQAGQCRQPCIPDQPCTPYLACYGGRTVCWDAYNGTCEPREPLQDGTSCGVDLVCRSGNCVSCGPAVSCQPPDPCYASGTLSCTTGRCEPQPPPYDDGLTCGVGGETCIGGTCTPVPGADPWVRSTSGAVDLAGTTWSDCIGDEPELGMSRLRVDTYVTGGITHQEVVFTSSPDCTGPTDPARPFTITGTITSGGDRLASWEGGYVPLGLPSSPTATAMDVSALESPVGPIQFKELVLVHDIVSPRQMYRGESKSGDAYPSDLKGSMPMAQVLACNAGELCTPGFPTCEVHRIDCSTGAPFCTGTGTFLTDATRCGDGHSWCQAGACVPVPTRSVTGTAWTTYWPDAGPLPTAEPVPLVSIAALQFPGPTYLPGNLYWDGTFEIPNVEEGAYQLEIQTQSMLSYVSTTSSTIDLGVDVLGRQYLAWAAAPTPVLFDVDGLSPWALGDVLEFASSNAGVAEFPFGLPNLITGPVGTTQLYGTFDWNGRPLVDAGAGDVAYVFQGSTTTDPAIGRVTTASGWAAIPPPPDFAIAEGLGGTVDVTLGPCPWAGAVTADWRRSAFEGYVPLVHPNATARNHRIVVGARPHDAALAPPFRSGNFAQFAGGLPLLIVQSDPGAGDVSLAGLPYGQFLPPPWREYRHDRVQVGVPFTAPGATASASLGSPLGYDIAAASAPSVVTPMIAPPGSLTINGADAWSGLVGVGTSPRIAWTAPAVSPEAAALFPGASLLYRVAVYEVRLTPAGGTQVAFLFEGRTTRTSYRLPGTGLVPGGRYVVAIEASLAAESLDAPLRRARERAYATVVSSEFIP